jgi:hypothetical protein
LFVHPKSHAHARQYLEGLLAPIERKGGWTIAEYAGEKEPKAMQRFLNLASWDADSLRDLNREYAVEDRGDPEGILVADPTGFAKKGTKSAGVQRQHSGTPGRIDNCQIGTFLAYVNRAGDRVLIDRELYIPEKSWFGDPQRCAEAVPPDLEFATRPAQVAAMVERTVRAGVPFRWFTADEEFGQNPGLRDYLETADLAYVMAVPKTTEFVDADDRTVAVDDLPARLRPNAWQRRACGIGTKGYRVYDWAVIDSAHPDHQYMIRRSIDDGALAYLGGWTVTSRSASRFPRPFAGPVESAERRRAQAVKSGSPRPSRSSHEQDVSDAKQDDSDASLGGSSSSAHRAGLSGLSAGRLLWLPSHDRWRQRA